MQKIQLLARFILLAAVLIAPFPLGSNRDWAWGPLGVLIAIALLLYAIWRSIADRYGADRMDGLALPAVLVGIPLIWAVIQTLNLPFLWPPNVLLASPLEVLGLPATSRISLDTEMGVSGILRLLTYFGTFWLCAEFGRQISFARHVTWGVVGSGVLVTLYGLIMQLDNGSCVVVTIVKAPIGSSCPFSGTFRNANNYGTFAGMTALICIADIQRRLLRIDPSSTNLRQRLQARLAILSGVGGVVGAATIILVGGLFLSGSKGAAASFIVACVTMIVLLNTARHRRTIATLISIAVVGVLLAAMIALGGEMLVLRLLGFLNVGDTDRIAIYVLAVQAIRLHPLLGWGLGCFESVYLVLQPVNVTATYDKAHNTYLEAAVELGVPAACLLFAGIAVPVARCCTGIFRRIRDAHYPAMAFGVGVLAAFESLFDFSIQIPANALTFSALLGVGWAQARSSRY